MTWTSLYIKHLADLTAKNESFASTHKTPLEIARGITAGNKWQYDYNKLSSERATGNGADLSPGNVLGNIGSGTWSAAKASLNFIERPFYGIMGATKAAMDDPNNKDQNPFLRMAMNTNALGLATNIATQSGAFGRGISGQEHTTSSDIYNKYLPGFEEMNPVGKFALSMGTDVAFDPLSYVGPGAIKALWKGGFKVAGKVGMGSGVAPKLGRAKNTTISAKPEPKPQAITPESLIKKDLTATGKAVAPDAAAETFVQKLARENARTQLQPAKTTPYEIRFADSAEKNILAASQPVKSTSELVDRAMLNIVSKEFSGMSTKLHAKGVDIEDIYKTVEPVKAPKGKGTKSPYKGFNNAKVQAFHDAMSVEEKANLNAAFDTIAKPRVESTHLDDLFGENRTIDLFDADGAKIMSTRSGIGSKKNTTLGIGKERLAGLIEGTGAKLAPTMKVELEGGKSFTPTYHIKVNGELVPLNKFIKDSKKASKEKAAPAANAFEAEVAAKAVSEGAQVPAKAGKAAEQAAGPAAEAAVPQKFDRVNFAIWRSKHPHLTTEEVQTISRARKPEEAAKRIAEIKLARASATETGKIRGFNDLEAAIANGTIDIKDPTFQAAIHRIVTATGIKSKGKAGIDASQRRVMKAFENIAKAEAGRTKISADDLKIVADTLAKERLTKLIDNPVAEEVKKRVISARDIVNGVLRNGDTTVFNKNKIVLDTAQHEAVQRVMSRTSTSQIREPLDKWKHRTLKNVPRNSPTPGLGDAKHPAMNMASQYTIAKDVIGEATKLIDASLKGPAREFALYNKAMPMLHATEQMLRQSGLPIVLGYGAKGLPLSLHDIFSALPRQFVEHHFFNSQSAIDVSQFGSIAQQLVRLAREEITPLQFDEAVFKTLGAPRRLKAETIRAGGQQFSNYASMKKWEKNPKDFIADAQRVADTFKSSSVNIMQALTRNSAETIVGVSGQAEKLTDAAMQKFAKVILDDKALPSDIIGVASNPAKLIDDAVREGAVGEAIVEGAKDLSKIQLEIRMAEVLDGPGVHVAEVAAEKYSKLITAEVRAGGKKALEANKAAIAAEMFRAADEEAALAMKAAGYATTDLGMRAEFANYVAMTRAFFPHTGNELLRPKLLGYRNLAQRDAMLYTAELSKIAKVSTIEQQMEAFRYLQSGTKAVEPAMIKLTDDIEKLWNQVLGDTHDKFGFIGRNGISGHDLVAKFDHFGIDTKKYPIDFNDVANSWKKWDITDPLETASKVHAAAQAVIAEKIIGASFTMNFGEKVWKPGLVEIKNTGGRSRIAQLIDTSLYYEKDIAQQMHLIDKTLEEFAKPATNNKLLRTLDSVLHSYKAGLTIYNAGHHLRNMTGDISLSYMDGMTNPKYYAKGHAIMATRNASHQGIDAIAAAKAAGIKDVGKSQSHVIHKGKKIELSPAQEYSLGYDVGMYPSYSVLEDLNLDARAAGDMVTGLRSRSPFKGNIQKVAAGVSEYRDHWVRASQFNWLIDGKVLDSSKSLPDALRMLSEEAGARVRKTHPDGSDLSEMERKVMRRSVLFYSWIRKAIPLVATGMVQRPGRFMMYPKATYNLAEAQGIDLQSFGDQFPTDQLFPPWMEDGTQGVMAGGPGNYWGMKPGNPASDVMDQYGTNPIGTLRTIMGSTNPLARVPYEMAAGTSMGTGSKIKDKSEYVDSQLPFASFINKITGRSVSSGFTQPLSVAPSNENYVPSIPVWLQQLLNKNLGTGITDMSKPSYIKQGQFAARDAARENFNRSGN